MEIKTPNRKYDISSITSADVSVKGVAAGDFKAGHLIFMGADGTYVANAVDTDLTDTAAPTDAVAVLLEDVTLGTTASTARAILAGKVWYDFIRDAGITEESCPDWLLQSYSAKQSAILFVDAKEVQYAN